MRALAPEPRHQSWTYAALLSVSILSHALAVASAQAQEWPEDAQWRVLRCGLVPSFDLRRDEPSAVAERDVVGDANAPALFMFADAEFAYFRMRVDADPRLDGELRTSAWAVEFDTNLDRRSYELIGIVDNFVDNPTNEPEVRLARNTRQDQQNDPADRPEEIVEQYPIETHARTLLAEASFASRFGDDPDYFVDWALPLEDLEDEGLSAISVIRLLFGTSLHGESIDGDVACHDGRRGNATWSEASSDPLRPNGSTVSDRDGDGLSDEEEGELGTNPDSSDSDGDGADDDDELRGGSDPNDNTSVPDGPINPPPGSDDDTELRGGGGPVGCSLRAAASSSERGLWLGLMLGALLVRRSKRAGKHRRTRG